MLHGWSGSKKSLEPVAQALQSAGYHTLLLEMPGHGATAEMQSPWHMSDFSSWLRDSINDANLKNYALAGHSFGGRIILDSILNNTVTPEKIVLVDISGVKPKNSFKKNSWKILSKLSKLIWIPEGVKRFIYKYIIRERDYINTSGNLRQTFKNINEQYYNKSLSQISVPTLIIWGESDQTTPLWMGKYLKQHIPHSKLELLEGSHSLPLSSPQKVANLIIEFLK